MPYSPLVEVRFPLESFRRFPEERLWAQRAEAGALRLRCVPFLAAGVHREDVVERSDDGQFHVLLPSGHRTERCLLAASLPHESRVRHFQTLASYGASIHEGSNGFCAIDVVPSGNHRAVHAQLSHWAREGTLTFATDEIELQKIALALGPSELPHWPFREDRTQPVLTLQSVLDGAPTLHVVRDVSAAGWQFLGWQTPGEQEARLATLSDMLSSDRSLAALAELPVGWHAWRKTLADPWSYEPQ